MVEADIAWAFGVGGAGGPWADPQAVLEARLVRLPRGPTEGSRLTVTNSWVAGDTSSCVMCGADFIHGVVGGRFTTELPDNGFPGDAAEFGQDIADFAIGEPLGAIADDLHVDANGVRWYGQLLGVCRAVMTR